jgi:hypothetical protein
MFSWPGLFIMYTAFTSLFFIVFYNELYKKNKDKLLSLIITFIAYWICKFAFVSRVQSIVYLLLFLEVLFLEKLYTTGEKKYSAYLLILSILVVNLQMPIWIFYIILILPYLVETIFSKIFKNKFDKCKNYKLFYISILLIVFSGLISPYGFIPYTYCLKSLGNPIYYEIGINEMKPLVLIGSKPHIGITLCFIVFMYFKFIKISLRDLCLFCGLFIFSLIVNKNIIFYLYFGLYIIAKNIDFTIIKKKLNSIYNRLNLPIIEIFLIVISTFGLVKVVKFKYENFNDFGYDVYPLGIVNYLHENTEYKNIKLFTDYNSGSYYLFHDLRTFIDSRAEVFMEEYNGGQNIIKDYIEISNPNTMQEIINKYNFDYFAIEIGDDKFMELIKLDGYCIVDRYREYTLIEKYNEKNVLKIY